MFVYSAELDIIEQVLGDNMDSKVTHTLGPQVCQVVFQIIRECLVAKARALENEIDTISDTITLCAANCSMYCTVHC